MKKYLLYYYEHGSLRVQGHKNASATGKFKHQFDSADECEIHATALNSNEKPALRKQFVIVEHNESFDSKIVKVLL